MTELNLNESNISYHFGFGGCKAPEAPLPISMPGSFYEIPRLLERQRSAGDDTVVVVPTVGRMLCGFGGCSAPERPVPVWFN